MPRSLSILSLLALIWLGLHEPAQAAPILQIRDRIDVEMDPVRRVDGLALVRGRLVERSSGQGLAFQRVRIKIDDVETTHDTDSAGFFSAPFAINEGTHLLSVDAPGNGNLDAAHFEMADFDISKRPLLLTLSAPSELNDTEHEANITISAYSDSELVPVDLSIFFGTAGTSLQEIGRVRTNEAESTSFLLSLNNLSGPGRKRIEVRFPGNTNFDAAFASANLNINETSTLNLLPDRSSYDYGDSLQVRGRLLDGRGNAILGALVSVDVNSQRVGNAKTDERGDYSLSIDSEELGSGSTTMQAMYRPSESWSRPSQSEPITIVIGQRKPVSLSSTLAAFALTSLALLSFIGMRTRPWERLRRARAPQELPRETRIENDVLPPTGLVSARPKLAANVRRAHDFHIDGTVLDAITRRPVAGAILVIVGSEERQLKSDALGFFAADPLPEGRYDIVVQAQFYVTEKFSVDLPHRGELRSAAVHLMPVREMIFSVYKEAVRDRLPSEQLWGIWTPRQILEHVRALQPSVGLSELTDFVEESFFSARSPGEEALVLAREKITAMQTESTSQRR